MICFKLGNSCKEMLIKYLTPIVTSIFDEEPSPNDMARLVAVFAVFWAIFFHIFSLVAKPILNGKSWLLAAGERFYARGGKEEYELMGLAQTKKDFLQAFIRTWPWMLAVATQHLIGGLLCVPSLVGGMMDQSTASSLACLGVLSEIGWEVEDTIMWLYTRYFTKDGKHKAPLSFLIFLIFHHSLTTVLGMPVILHYRHSKILHWLCFDLQLAGASVIYGMEYSKLLDVGNPSELKQFQLINFLLLVVIFWTRAVHWVYLVTKFCIIWYKDKAWWFLGIGSTVSLLFTVFNIFLCLIPIYKRFRKFMFMSADYKELPSDADEAIRRKSVIALQKAANDVLCDFQLQREMMELFSQNKHERRHTMPAGVLKIKRNSITLLRASAADISSILSRMQ